MARDGFDVCIEYYMHMVRSYTSVVVVLTMHMCIKTAFWSLRSRTLTDYAGIIILRIRI